MPLITFIGADGTKYKVEADIGSTVRHAAVQNDVTGIEGSSKALCCAQACARLVPQLGSFHAESRTAAAR